MERTHIKNLSGEVGKEVTVAGWVNIRRDHGKLIFIDLRDETGIVQMVVSPKQEEALKAAEEVRPEWVLKVSGNVKERPADMVNKDLPLGNIELEVTGVAVLSKAETPPFDPSTDTREVGEETRLADRYIDLRSERMQKNIRNRARVVKKVRDVLENEGFVEIETPILTKSTPEGARDFVVPSRQEQGKFYALPQSPQQYKQLLMGSGFEKYFQIARCFRDEDTRGDRQAEFTQIDIETAFPTQDAILSLVENMYTDIVKEIYPDKKITKEPWPRLNYEDVMKEYGTDSPDLREDKNDPNELAFAWIFDFPLFEKGKENGNFAPSHHMFTAPKEDDLDKLDSAPGEVRAYQHDLVLNGYEVGGGSIRIHDPKIQSKIFDLIGFDEKDKANFEHMLRAFSFGIPPHGGIAMGLERFLMLLEGESSIREVMAFPKTGEGRDLTMDAPSEIKDEQLKDLGLSVSKKDKKK